MVYKKIMIESIECIKQLKEKHIVENQIYRNNKCKKRMIKKELNLQKIKKKINGKQLMTILHQQELSENKKNLKSQTLI